MTLSLRPIVAQDLPRVAYLRLGAFDGTPTARAMRPGPITPDNLSWMNYRIKKDFERSNITFIGVFDDSTGELVSYAEWEMIDAQSRAQPEEKTEWPDFMNGKALDEFWSRYEALKKEVMGDRDYLLLSILATDKAHRGRGAASMLLRWGINHASVLDVDIFLDATEDGKPLYTKFGFEVNKTREMDLRRYGVDHTNINYGMVWTVNGLSCKELRAQSVDPSR